jgi:hypothetical protein
MHGEHNVKSWSPISRQLNVLLIYDFQTMSNYLIRDYAKFMLCGSTMDMPNMLLINLFVFNHFIIRNENSHRLPTFARIGTQSACSNVTLNQIPRKLFSVHCFSDAVKVNICQFQFQLW